MELLGKYGVFQPFYGSLTDRNFLLRYKLPLFPCHSLPYSAFLTDEANTHIRNTFSQQNLGSVEGVEEPYQIRLAAQKQKKESTDSSDDYWWALMVLAGLIILFCIVGMIVICYTWARSVC